jgi:prepilin signal peptidase PulO-like enzyme (type II secretory pathway)
MRGTPFAIANSFKSASLAFIFLVEIAAPYLPDFVARYVVGTLLPINERYPIILLLVVVLAAFFIAASMKEVLHWMKFVFNGLVTLAVITAPIVVLARFVSLTVAVVVVTVFFLLSGLAVTFLTPRSDSRLA